MPSIVWEGVYLVPSGCGEWKCSLLPRDGLVLDVGCGFGATVNELVSRGHRVVGIDISNYLVTLGRERFPDCELWVASAEALPFRDASVSCYRAERVYQYLPRPRLALSEAYRVIAPGGRVLLIEQDYDMLALEADNEELTQRLVRALAAVSPQPWAGRRSRNLLLDTGFTQVNVSVEFQLHTDHTELAQLLTSMGESGVASGAASREEVTAWLAEQERRGKRQRFFAVLPIFVVHAIRP